MPIDFESAKRYALGRLQRELAPELSYHSIAHTQHDVVPAAGRLAACEEVTGENLILLLTAAYFHDIGFIERYDDNEIIAVRIAAESLPGFGYSPEHVQTICGLILTTRLPQTPHNLLEQIMSDADLDVLGRPDFLESNQLLRAEWSAMLGQTFSDREWYEEQVAFLTSHSYFTDAAHRLRDHGKLRNLACVQEMLARL